MKSTPNKRFTMVRLPQGIKARWAHVESYGEQGKELVIRIPLDANNDWQAVVPASKPKATPESQISRKQVLQIAMAMEGQQ